jgi:hypothetical protein
MIDLGSLAGASSPYAINALGEIAGVSQTLNGGPVHAVLWRVALSPADLIASLIAAASDANLQQATQLLKNALRSIGRGDTVTACNQMRAFTSQVRAQTGKGLTLIQANGLLLLAADIRAALGCQ